MTETADAIVVGAGVNGASLAFHLARAGMKPLILESRAVGAGATGRSSGFVIMHPYRRPEAHLSWVSLGYFRDWADRVGGDCGFVRTGFIRVVPRDAESVLRQNVVLHQSLGISTFLVSATDIGVLAPGMVASDFDFASYEPESGYADPTSATNELFTAARSMGASFVRGALVSKVLAHGSKVTGVEASTGRYSAPIVVDVAGSWASAVAATIGVELPVRVWRHDVAYVQRPASLGPTHPAVVDQINSVYFRPEGKSLTLAALQDGNEITDDPDRETDSVEDGFSERVAERLCRRMPAMTQGVLQTTHSGQDGISPDQRPILGAAGPEGFFVACGFSGTGFKMAPAVGLCMSEVVLNGRATTVDISELALDRFGDGPQVLRDESVLPIWT